MGTFLSPRIYGPVIAASASSVVILSALLIKSFLPDSSISTYYDPNFHDLSKEAKVGSKLLIDRDWKDHPLFSNSNKVLLVLMGGCQSCSRNHYVIGKESDRKFSEVVFVFNNSPTEFDKATRSLPPKYRVIADPKQVLDHQLNAEWYPRLFVIDGDGKLIKAQSPNTTTDQFLRAQS